MAQSAAHPWSVLVVDDSETIRQLLRAYLEAEGYIVEEASDGLKAFARLSHRAARYLVLLDYAMPQLDGWGVLRLAAADPRLLTQHVYIVMTAAQTSLPTACERFLTEQAIPRVFKPIAWRDLLGLLALAEAQMARLTPPPAPTTSAPTTVVRLPEPS